jgi:hypothetical protein
MSSPVARPRPHAEPGSGRSSGEVRRGHRTVAHTADLRVEAWAPSREQCIAEAVLGTVAAFVDTSSAPAEGHRTAGAVPVRRIAGQARCNPARARAGCDGDRGGHRWRRWDS